jgi:hypothetical protein
MVVKKEEGERINKEEQVGFHKGALDTLLKERSELLRLITIVDQLIKLHAGALQELGVKLTKKDMSSDGKKLEEKL